MKKVLSIVLSLSMVLGSFGLAFAATPNVASKFSDVNGKNCEEAVKVLSDLNVVTGYDDGTYKPENIVTRAEMAVLVVNALGLQNYVTTNAKSTFKDMDNYGWAEGYISYAQSLGIVSGYGDGTFKPGKTVSYDEAATMLVAALGYTPASLQGTWPANYVTKAKSLGILDNVKAGVDGANRGDTAIMLYQTLTQKIGTVNKDNVWNENQGKQITIPTYKDKVNAGDKMIYRLGADPDQTKIDTIIMGDEDSNINLAPYVGMCATTYSKDSKVIAVTDIQSTFISGTFSKTDLNSFTGDDDVDYTISLTGKAENYQDWSGVVALYNGKPATSAQLENAGFTVEKGVITGTNKDYKGDIDATLAVKDNGKTIKTLYSISIWDHSLGADKKVTDADINAIKNDKTLLGCDFTTLKDGSIDMNSFTLMGVSSLDKIAKDNVVFVYTNDAKSPTITRVEVSQDTISGEITKENLAGDKYTIDGKTYSTSKGKSFDYNVGDTIKAYLDPKGKIYAVDDVNSTAGDYAVVVGLPDQNGAFNYAVKLFTKDGNSTVFNFKDDSAYHAALALNLKQGDLVTYELNSAGQITKMINKTNADQKKPQVPTKLSGKVNNGVVNGIQLADNAVVFTVSTNKDGTYDYDVISPKSIDKDENITNGNNTPAGNYAMNSNGDRVVAMIIDNGASGGSNSYGFVDSASKVKNSKGDTVRKVDAFIDGKEVNAMTDTNGAYDAIDSGTGDVVSNHLMRFEFNGDVITNIVEMNSFLDYKAYPSDSITKDIVKIFDNGDWQKVYDTNNDALKVSNAKTGTKDDAAFISVKGAKAYRAVMASDGTGFDHWALGDVSNISTGYEVAMFQVSKDSSAPDVVVYVTKSDLNSTSDLKLDFHSGNVDHNTSAPAKEGWTFSNGTTTNAAIDVVEGVTADAVVTAPTETASGTVVVTPSGTPTTTGSIVYTLTTGSTSDKVTTSVVGTGLSATTSDWATGTATLAIAKPTPVAGDAKITFTIDTARKDVTNLMVTAKFVPNAKTYALSAATSPEVKAGITAQLTDPAKSLAAGADASVSVAVTVATTTASDYGSPGGMFTLQLVDAANPTTVIATQDLTVAKGGTKAMAGDTEFTKFTFKMPEGALKVTPKIIGTDAVDLTVSTATVSAPDTAGKVYMDVTGGKLSGFNKSLNDTVRVTLHNASDSVQNIALTIDNGTITSEKTFTLAPGATKADVTVKIELPAKTATANLTITASVPK